MALPPLTPAVFQERENRFRARCDLNGRPVWAHVAATGRLGELLVPGQVVWLAAAGHSRRQLAWDLVLVRHGPRLVCVDTRLPNALLRAAAGAGLVPGLAAVALRAEVPHGHSRFDFLAATDPVTWIEVKSVTLVQHGVAIFPDAPTRRGARHLDELRQRVATGERALVVFMVLRDDARLIRPNGATDPTFCAALTAAVAAGVTVIGLRCRVTTHAITPLEIIPVELEPAVPA